MRKYANDAIVIQAVTTGKPPESGSGVRRDKAALVMEWAEDDGAHYLFGLAGNPALDALVPSCPRLTNPQLRPCVSQ
jgi:hypothetical protein